MACCGHGKSDVHSIACLEQIVCGANIIDVKVLQQAATYEFCSPSDQHIQYVLQLDLPPILHVFAVCSVG